MDYTNLIDRAEFTILYHIFSRINGIKSWYEICNELGFDRYFNAGHFKELYAVILNLEIRAKAKSQNQLRFFMQLIIYYWDNLPNDFEDELDDDEHSNFGYFLDQMLIENCQGICFYLFTIWTKMHKIWSKSTYFYYHLIIFFIFVNK